MASSWRTVRVFISSTFRDMHAERDHLVKVVFPSLRARLGVLLLPRSDPLAIDALNQLDEADRAQELHWLPRELPPQVKVIVSCITDSGKTEPVPEAFRWRKHCPVQLAALSDAEQREI